jgi:integrase
LSASIPNLTRAPKGYWRTTWTDDAGKRHYKSFGRERTAARNRFNRWLVSWRNDHRVRTPDGEGPITIARAWEIYHAHADAYYRRRDGSPTGEAQSTAYAMAPVLALYGAKCASDFSPRMLLAVRDEMVESGSCLNTVNRRVSAVRRVWGWLTEQELISASTWHALKAVRPLQAGRTKAPARERVAPVPVAWVDRTCEVLPPSLIAMVRLQLLTGMRPGEICAMRPRDLDTTDQIWIYRPPQHKAAHRNQVRRIPIGPKGQSEMQPYLGREPAESIFRPADALRERHAATRAAYVPPEDGYDYRQMPSYQSRPRRSRGSGDVKLGWTVASYRRAIGRAAKQAGVPHWHPHQLRHTAASQVRAKWGLDGSQLLLGHRHADVTEVYAEADMGRMKEMVLERG